MDVLIPFSWLLAVRPASASMAAATAAARYPPSMSTTGTWAGLNRNETQKPPNLTESLARRSVDEPGRFMGTKRPQRKPTEKCSHVLQNLLAFERPQYELTAKNFAFTFVQCAGECKKYSFATVQEPPGLSNLPVPTKKSSKKEVAA